jgi:hypothetical protein
VVTWWHPLQHWFLHYTGSDNTSGTWYGFWSGFGSDLSEIMIVGALLAVLRKHNCHVHGCWRIGRHPVEGTGYVVCRRHHPDPPLSAEHVTRRHRIEQAWRHRLHGGHS